MQERSPFLLKTFTCLQSARLNFTEDCNLLSGESCPRQTHVPSLGLDFWQGTPTVLGDTAPGWDFPHIYEKRCPNSCPLKSRVGVRARRGGSSSRRGVRWGWRTWLFPLPVVPVSRRQLPARLAKSVLTPVLALPGLARFHAVGWKG